MRVAHWTSWAPRQSGMFESVKDQIKYERREGLDSFLCDPHDKHRGGRTEVDDGWFSAVSWKEAETADIQVLHSWIPDEVRKNKKSKFVAVLHGPSEHMLLKEWVTERAEEAFNLHINILWKYDATVVLNKHELDIMELYDEKGRIHYIPNSIDLERYQDPGQIKWEYRNHPAIGSFDVTRLEKLPAHIIWAMPRIVNRIPSARLNVYGFALEPIATWRNIFCRSKERRLEYLCENIQLESKNLVPYMRGVDIGFNNNMSGIASRVSMEMMAMGVPIVSYDGDYTKYHATIWDLESIAEQVERCWKDLTTEGSTLRADTLKYANDNFDRGKEVKKYVELYHKVLGA